MPAMSQRYPALQDTQSTIYPQGTIYLLKPNMDRNMKAKTLCPECVGITFDDVAGDAIGALDLMTCWERGDTLPDLPHFSLSAKNGCSFCAFLCHLLRERLPKQYAAVTETAGCPRVVTVKLDTPAYTMRSDLMVVTNDLAGNNDAEEEDGLHSLCLTFGSKGWPQDWRVRVRVYQHPGSSTSLLMSKLAVTESRAYIRCSGCL